MDDGEGKATTGRCLCGDIRFDIGARRSRLGIAIAELQGDTPRHPSWPMSSSTRALSATRKGCGPYASSPGVERTHCGRCGSPIAFGIARNLLLGRYARRPTTVAPTYHCFTAQQLPMIKSPTRYRATRTVRRMRLPRDMDPDYQPNERRTQLTWPLRRLFDFVVDPINEQAGNKVMPAPAQCLD